MSMAAMDLRSKLAKPARTQNPERPLQCTVLAVTSCRTCRSRWTRSTSLRRGSPSPGSRVGGLPHCPTPHLLRGQQCVSATVLQSSPAAGPAPSCPDQGGQHCENAVTTKKLEFAAPLLPITQSQSQPPPGALGPCARAPVVPAVQELRPCCLQSRKLCTLCGRNLHSHFFCS